jgi:small subunit ribosomal protein S5
MSKKNYKEDNVKESLLAVKRVAKVVKGGRRFSFSALVVAGDKNGKVGYGRRKAKEVSDAREKASKVARKDVEKRKIPLYQDRTIHHDVFGRSGASRVILKRSKPGTGIIAGGPMRAILEMIGIKDIVAKSLGSSNVYNVIDATLNALAMLSTPRAIAERRDKKVNEISVSSSK